MQRNVIFTRKAPRNLLFSRVEGTKSGLACQGDLDERIALSAADADHALLGGERRGFARAAYALAAGNDGVLALGTGLTAAVSVRPAADVRTARTAARQLGAPGAPGRAGRGLLQHLSVRGAPDHDRNQRRADQLDDAAVDRPHRAAVVRRQDDGPAAGRHPAVARGRRRYRQSRRCRGADAARFQPGGSAPGRRLIDLGDVYGALAVAARRHRHPGVPRRHGRRRHRAAHAAALPRRAGERPRCRVECGIRRRDGLFRGVSVDSFLSVLEPRGAAHRRQSCRAVPVPGAGVRRRARRHVSRRAVAFLSSGRRGIDFYRHRYHRPASGAKETSGSTSTAATAMD